MTRDTPPVASQSAPDAVERRRKELHARGAMTGGTLVLTVGLPYAGKSTWARGTRLPIVSPDAIRRALHGERYLEAAEPWVWLHARAMVAALFGAGHGLVIVDGTHTTRQAREEWREWTGRSPIEALGGIRVLLHVLATSPAQCIERAECAQDRDIVPVIRRMRDQYEPPGEGEPLWLHRGLGGLDVVARMPEQTSSPHRTSIMDREVL